MDINITEDPTELRANVLPIRTWPDDSSLHNKSEDVTGFNEELEQLSRDLFVTMKQHNGIGLAAPQVGVFVNVIAIWMEQDTSYLFVNPKITEASDEMFSWEEGCLSVPGYFDQRERSKRIVVSYQDVTGKQREAMAYDLLAFAIQHEIDHLDGKLFIDDLSRLKKGRVVTKVKKYIKQNK